MGATDSNVEMDSWAQVRTLVLSDEQSWPSSRRAPDRDRLFVMTPLDLIAHLELWEIPVSTVVLAGSFGGNRELASFLLEAYPAVRIVDVVARAG